MRAHGRQFGDALLVEPIGAVPPDCRPADVIALDLVIGDGEVDPAVVVEVGRDAGGRGVREQPRAILGRKPAPLAVPVDVGIDIAQRNIVVGTDEEIQHAVVVEIGDGHGIGAACGEEGAPVLPQTVRPVPVDADEGVVGHIRARHESADDQVQVSVAIEVGTAGAGAEIDRQGLGARHAVAVRTAPQHKAAIVLDVGHNDIQPAVVIEVGAEQPARVAVDLAIILQADFARVAGVESIGRAVKDQQLFLVDAAEYEIEIAVLVEICTEHPVRLDRWHGIRRFVRKPVRPAEVDERAGIEVVRILRTIADHQVGPTVVINVAADGIDGSPAGQRQLAVGVISIRPALVEVDVEIAEGAAGKVINQDQLRQRLFGLAQQQHPARVLRHNRDGFRDRFIAADAAIDRGGRGERLRQTVLAEHNLVAAVAVEIAEYDVAGAMAGQQCAARFRITAIASPVHHGVLPVILLQAAGKDQVIDAVAIHITDRDGHVYCAVEHERRGEAAGAGFERHKIRRSFSRDIDIRDLVQDHHADQRRRVGDVLGVFTGFVDRCGRVHLDRHHGERLRVDPVGPAPVDADFAVGSSHDQVGKAVAVDIGGIELLHLDVHVDKALGLEPDGRLIEDSDRAVVGGPVGLDLQRDIHLPVTVEITCRRAFAQRRRQLLAVAFARAFGRAEVD